VSALLDVAHAAITANAYVLMSARFRRFRQYLYGTEVVLEEESVTPEDRLTLERTAFDV
jgi:hypothetical protein